MSDGLDNTGRSVVILGATSPIARATAEAFARHGWGVLLAARDREECEAIAADLRVRGGGAVWTRDLAVGDDASRAAFVEDCFQALGDSLEGVVYCVGSMPPQEDCQRDAATAQGVIEVNYALGVVLLERFAERLEQRRRGWICGVSSVAGDRGRMSNYIYGSAKAGFSAYLDGLRNRLWHAGVHVATVKPGPVDTPMTYGLGKLPLLAQPGPVGQWIYNGIVKRKNVIYAPPVWRWVMAIVRAIPEWQFKKMKM
jgi:NAD(P)-dependent dehydrogenase (short-subunit alcohol dehydrogenase family)